MRKSWKPASHEEAIKRAAGHRRYNATRQAVAFERQLRIMELIKKYGWNYGSQAEMARELKVSQATISRDMDTLLKTREVCPVCGTPQ